MTFNPMSILSILLGGDPFRPYIEHDHRLYFLLRKKTQPTAVFRDCVTITCTIGLWRSPIVKVIIAQSLSIIHHNLTSWLILF